jgi:hypothetical protein
MQTAHLRSRLLLQAQSALGIKSRPKKSHLFLFPQSEQTNARDLDHLESHTRNITLGLATATETRDQDLVVLVDKVQATIVLRFWSDTEPARKCGALTGTKAVTFFPFLMSCTRTHFRMAELGCLASTPTFSRTIPFAWDEPPVGEVR